MSKVLLVILQVCFISQISQAYPSTPDEYRQAIRDHMHAFSNATGTAYQFAVSHNDLNFTYASGIENHVTQKEMTTSSLIPLGSVTKAYTVMGIMRLIEQGAIGFNDSISIHVDEILMKSNGTTLSQIWKDDKTLENVTIYNLMHMQAGLNDYDDGAMLAWTLAHPDEDFTPLDYLHNVNKTWVCEPGTCEYYSSIGISLLSFALAQHAGANNWFEYDQFSMFPEDLRSNYFKNTLWMKQGKCSQYQNVTQQYMLAKKNEWPGTEYYYLDLDNFSCLDGWGFGNIAATAEDVAKFFYQYLGTENLIKKETLAQMMNWEMGGGSDGFKFIYGLGFMPLMWPVKHDQVATEFKKYAVIGHAGLDWGSYADLAGYNQYYNFSIVNAQNSNFGWNCSKGDDFETYGYVVGDRLNCFLLNETIQYFSNGTGPQLNCSEDIHWGEWENGKPEQDIILNNKLKAKRIQEVPRNLLTSSGPESPVCYPHCNTCLVGRCASCQNCVGNASIECLRCFVPAKGELQPCLSPIQDRCEVCFANMASQQNFLQ